MSFSEAEEDKLINIISKHEVIYDTGHANYRNNVFKETIWKRIGEELNKNSEECKKKWKFFRDGYIRFKKKHKLGTGSGAPKNPKNQRHQQLLFLDGVSQHRSGGSNIPTSPQELTENEEDADQLSSEKQVLVGESTDEVLSSNNETQNDDDSVIETLNNESREQTPRVQTRPKEKRRTRNTEDELLKMWKKRDEKRQKILESTLKKKDDDVELFSRHIAEVLRNLPPLQKAEAKKQLSIILSDYEIKAATNAFTTPSSSGLSHNISFPDFLASSSSSEYTNTSYTQRPVHYMSNAYSPLTATTSPEPIELSFQVNEESEEPKRTAIDKL